MKIIIIKTFIFLIISANLKNSTFGVGNGTKNVWFFVITFGLSKSWFDDFSRNFELNPSFLIKFKHSIKKSLNLIYLGVSLCLINCSIVKYLFVGIFVLK